MVKITIHIVFLIFTTNLIYGQDSINLGNQDSLVNEINQLIDENLKIYKKHWPELKKKAIRIAENEYKNCITTEYTYYNNFLHDIFCYTNKKRLISAIKRKKLLIRGWGDSTLYKTQNQRIEVQVLFKWWDCIYQNNYIIDSVFKKIELEFYNTYMEFYYYKGNLILFKEDETKKPCGYKGNYKAIYYFKDNQVIKSKTSGTHGKSRKKYPEHEGNILSTSEDILNVAKYVFNNKDVGKLYFKY